MNDGARRWVMPGVIAGLVVVLVVVALVREPAEFDAGTPEGVVQRYLQAINDKEYDSAFEYLDPDFYENCDPADLARHTGAEPFGATLGESTQTNDDAFVEVSMQFGAGEGPFGSGWTTYESFHLIGSNGSWLITGEVWPYFSWDCGVNF